jgi:hypothetical protein
VILLVLALTFDAHSADLRYPECEAGANDYLEAALSLPAPRPSDCPPETPGEAALTALFTKLVGAIDPAAFPPACTHASLASAPLPYDTLFYGACTADGGFSKVARPCLSERYHRLVHNSYVLAMRCLGVDPKELFPVLNVESGFEVNAGNPAGAWGVAQLTGIAAREVRRRGELARLAALPECAPVRPALEAPFDPRARGFLCSRIAIPPNPALGLIYAGILHRANQRTARQLVSRWTNPSLDRRDRARLVTYLARTMYNAGSSGISQAFLTFVQEQGNEALDLAGFIEAFPRFLGTNYLRGENEPAERTARMVPRREEVSTYMSRIETRAAAIRRSTGVACAL